jgi:hypothetical protein
VEREEAGTRATKREHSITLAAPAGNEPDQVTCQVLPSTLLRLGANGGLSLGAPAQRGAMRLPERRPVRPPRSRGTRAQHDDSRTAAV